MTPNDLFDVSSKMDGDVPKLSSWTMKIALKLEDASPAMRDRCHAPRGTEATSVDRLTPAGHSAWIAASPADLALAPSGWGFSFLSRR
jgi:hypothetical protein